ncbi:MAG: hypothetical protein DRN20_03015 [Thermoplasmata archaeon]|nr:MAG: hypothetical protein DRN20_03015 [Thermoplasmata archaeon]
MKNLDISVAEDFNILLGLRISVIMSMEQLMVKVIEAYGYTIKEITGNVLVAEKDGMRIAILVHREELKGEGVMEFLDAHKANVHIIISLGGGITSHPNAIIWSGERLEQIVGKAFIALAEGKRVAGDIIDTTDIPQYLPLANGDCVKPIISRDEITIYEDTIGSIRDVKTIHVPYYLFHYSCTLSSGSTTMGLVWVDGVSGKASIIRSKIEAADIAPESVEELKVSLESAMERAMEECYRVNIRERESIIDRGTATIVERHKDLPKEGSISLSKPAIVWVPTYLVVGSGGSIVINAITGEMISQD